MENNVKRKLKDDGTYVEVATTSTTPQDSITPNYLNDEPNNQSTIGYQTYKHIETDDPRIVKPFLYGFCLLFYIIGIFLFFIKLYVFGILFIIMTTICFISNLNSIKKHEQELLKNPTYDPNDKEVIKEFNQTIKEEVQDMNKKTFTKSNFQWFVKTSLPFYIIISIICSVIITIILANMYSLFIGILSFFGSLIGFTIIALIYFSLISLLFRN